MKINKIFLLLFFIFSISFLYTSENNDRNKINYEITLGCSFNFQGLFDVFSGNFKINSRFIPNFIRFSNIFIINKYSSIGFSSNLGFTFFEDYEYYNKSNQFTNGLINLDFRLINKFSKDLLNSYHRVLIEYGIYIFSIFNHLDYNGNDIINKLCFGPKIFIGYNFSNFIDINIGGTFDLNFGNINLKDLNFNNYFALALGIEFSFGLSIKSYNKNKYLEEIKS